MTMTNAPCGTALTDAQPRLLVTTRDIAAVFAWSRPIDQAALQAECAGRAIIEDHDGAKHFGESLYSKQVACRGECVNEVREEFGELNDDVSQVGL